MAYNEINLKNEKPIKAYHENLVLYKKCLVYYGEIFPWHQMEVWTTDLYLFLPEKPNASFFDYLISFLRYVAEVSIEVLGDAVDEVSPTKVVNWIHIQRSDGLVRRIKESYTLTELGTVNRVGADIEQHILEWQLPLAIQAFDERKLLKYGEYNISKEGISRSECVLEWDEIIRLSPRAAMQISSKKDPSVVWRLATPNITPNSFVLYALIDHILEQQLRQ